MFVNPSRALVEKPSLVASSSGSAKKARYARLFPSTRNRSASRAGASSSWSSAPVSVFGDIFASLRRMARLELVPFADEHLEDAARLLAARHARHRRAEALLPKRFEDAGHAVAEAEDVRDLYAAAAGRWVEEGRTRHYALVPDTDSALLDAWFRLGFGQQQAHGSREIPTRTEVQVPEG